MTRSCRLLALPLLIALAGCGDKGSTPDSERKTAAGEVLGGTISDDMLPLDTVTSQSPPLRESGGNAPKEGSSAEASDSSAEIDTPSAPSASSATPADAPADE